MKESASPTKLIVMTIGSSTRTSEEFIQLLKAHQAQRPVDVRTVSRSRHNPQFNPSVLSPAMLPPSLHLFSRLGGFRHARRDSLNAGWHNASFRGFADYMQMTESRGNLEEFIDLAKSEQIAIMCAEAVPWRCHCSLKRTCCWPTELKSGKSQAQPAPSCTPLPWGKITGKQVTYPAEHKDQNTGD